MNKLLALLGLPAVMASTYSIDGGKTTYFRQINHQVYGMQGNFRVTADAIYIENMLMPTFLSSLEAGGWSMLTGQFQPYCNAKRWPADIVVVVVVSRLAAARHAADASLWHGCCRPCA